MFRPVFRTLSLLEQWGAEVLRQPGLMFTLVLAPFLLLLAFGEGLDLVGPRPQTVIVQEADSEVELDDLLERVDQSIEITGITESLPLARRSLARGDIDAVIVVPDDPDGYVDRGERIPVRVLMGEIDPVRRSYARSYMREQVSTLNQEAVTAVIEEAQASAGEVEELTGSAREYINALSGARDDVESAREQVAELQAVLEPLTAAVTRVADTTGGIAFALPGLGDVREETARLREQAVELQHTVDLFDRRLAAVEDDGSIPSDEELADLDASLTTVDEALGEIAVLPPEVLSAPFHLEMEDVTPTELTFTTFYSPGVLALLIQHLAITLGALTMARMRLLRVTEMLRVAPIRPVEVVLGSYTSYTLLSGLAAAGLMALLILALNVPVAGSYLVVAALIALLILVSLGIGFVVSLLSSSVQQAVQVSMLILLGSIFFSGFAFSLDQISEPIRWLSFAFPATYGIRSLQDTMLRGLVRQPEDLIILGVAAVALFALTVYLMRRELRAER